MLTDAVLLHCNVSELIQLARKQGLPPLLRSIPKEELAAIVAGEVAVQERHLCRQQMETRQKLEKYIAENIDSNPTIRPGLVSLGCRGNCTTHTCTEALHATCYRPLK